MSEYYMLISKLTLKNVIFIKRGKFNEQSFY